MTFKSAILDKRVRISSWMPSAKYALALSSLRFSNGSTAMLFSGAIGTVAAAGAGVIEAAFADFGAVWREKNQTAPTRSKRAITAMPMRRDFGLRVADAGRIGAACRRCALANFSGSAAFPAWSV